MRLVIVADGDPRSESTNSGVPAGLITALENRDDVSVVGTIDSRPHGLWKLLMMGMSFRFSKNGWRNEFRKGSLSTTSRSVTRDRALQRLARYAEFDVVIHVRNTYRPSRWCYANFLDTTGRLSQMGWADWRLGRRSFARRTRAEFKQFEGAIAVYTAAENVAQSVVADYHQAPEKVRAVGGGTNLAPLADVRRTARDGLTVLFVGKDFNRKGGAQLVKAFDLLVALQPNCRLIVVGPREKPREIEGRSWVEFHSHLSDRGRLNEIYSAADIFCLPAIYEPYGLVVQEALAYGLPCIVSNVGALPDMVGHGVAGTVVSSRNVQELFEALVSYSRDPTLIELKRAGIEAVRSEATWERVADRMITHLKGLVDPTGASGL